ncbi:MAG: hypothetical protein JWP87_1664 [Labilithrix sp.]|nr:hypothetical protein [Labilithrix sp.]
MTDDVFEDDLTRELPSALRTFTDLEPFDPRAVAPVAPRAEESSIEVSDEDILIERTVQLPPVSRPISIPAFTRDVPSRSSPWWQETLVIGAAFLVACLVVGTVGVLVGRASSSSDRAATAAARIPRTLVVLAAHEQLVLPPATAPMKLEIEAPAAAPIVAPPRPPPAATQRVQPPAPIEPRRAGFQKPATLTRR